MAMSLLGWSCVVCAENAPYALNIVTRAPWYSKELSRYAVVTETSSHQDLITVHIPTRHIPTDGEDAYLEDFNFDGYTDLAVFSGAGNVQVFFDVYLFDPSQHKFILNKKLSSIACIEVVPAQKILQGTCFHDSACENWSEYYRWVGNALVLIKREGTKCPPMGHNGNCYYEYQEQLRSGKLRTTYKKLICE